MPVLVELRPNKKISMFRVKGLRILGRVGTHIYIIFNSLSEDFLCILKGVLPFKMQKKYIFFPENLKKILGFTSKFRKGLGYPKHRYLFIYLALV